MPTKAQLEDRVDELELQLWEGKAGEEKYRHAHNDGYMRAIDDIKALEQAGVIKGSEYTSVLVRLVDVLSAHYSECLQLWAISSTEKDIPPPDVLAHKARH